MQSALWPPPNARQEEIGQPMNIAVVDTGGNLVAHVRMDTAWIGSVDISINKAWTARAFDIATKELAELSQSGDQDFRPWHSAQAERWSRRRSRSQRRYGQGRSGGG